jgi:palmitoyl-protein thioesterase
MFDSLLGDAAYLSLAQNVLAQANYFRDPKRIDAYLKGNIWLPKVNNEVEPNLNYTSNFESLTQLICVKALADTMVWPNEVNVVLLSSLFF